MKYIFLILGLGCVSFFNKACSTNALSDCRFLSVGPMTKIFDQSIGEQRPWHVNDHCFVVGPDKQWHLFGITAEDSKGLKKKDRNLLNSMVFAYAKASSLTQTPWDKVPEFFPLKADRRWEPWYIWAPYTLKHEDFYYLYYCAVNKTDRSQYGIHLATSKDFKTWTRHAKTPLFRDGYGARDPFVMRIADQWVMYYTATSAPDGGHHVVAYRLSDDLVNWGDKKIAYTDPMVGTRGGPTESPFVVKRGKHFYLFIGPQGGYDLNFSKTVVFRSQNPFQWQPEDAVGTIDVHAPELIQDHDGAWYISHCGPGEGGVYLLPLEWHDGGEKTETNQ